MHDWSVGLLQPLSKCIRRDVARKRALTKREADASGSIVNAASGDIEMGVLSFWDVKPGTVELTAGKGSAAGDWPGQDASSIIAHPQPVKISQANEQRLRCSHASWLS